LESTSIIVLLLQALIDSLLLVMLLDLLLVLAHTTDLDYSECRSNLQ